MNENIMKLINKTDELTIQIEENNVKLALILEESSKIEQKQILDLNDLSIRSLHDLYNVSNESSDKATFKDIIRYNELKKNAAAILDEQEILIANAKASKIELLQAQIEDLLKEE
jgi:hypothetical protein